MKIKLLLIALIFLLLPFNAQGELFYPIKKLVRSTIKEKQKPIPKMRNTVKIPPFHLSAIITSNSKKIALINGIYVKEGDKIDTCTVKKITTSPPLVILKCKGIEVKLKINLTD